MESGQDSVQLVDLGLGLILDVDSVLRPRSHWRDFHGSSAQNQGGGPGRHKLTALGVLPVSLRAQVRRTITAFLLAQMNNGAFRSREPAKAFFVDVSDQLNTPSVIFAGKLIARVGLATNKPAEFVIIRISQDTRALEVELAAAGE